jgi:RHS repeat-associated protein
MYDAPTYGYDKVVTSSEDNNGNTLTKVVGSNTTNYSWDFENRLSSVTLPGSGGTVSFKYDPFGRRIYKSSSSGTSIFAYDQDNVTEETNPTGSVVARYAQGLRIDEPLAMLRSATTNYYQADGLKSITSLSDSTGSVSATYNYDSFGNQMSSTGSLVNPFQYAAREFDSETGLYYYRARHYAPNVGRFASEDPVRFDAGQNFYQYVSNNPTLFIDPTGLVQILPEDPSINTVVCDGHGHMRVQFRKPAPSPDVARCTQDCVRVHEESHIEDALKTNPKVCKGQLENKVVGFSNPEEKKIGELKAFNAELDCLENKVNHLCKGCFQAIIDAKQNAQERKVEVNNGTYGVH